MDSAMKGLMGQSPPTQNFCASTTLVIQGHDFIAIYPVKNNKICNNFIKVKIATAAISSAAPECNTYCVCICVYRY